MPLNCVIIDDEPLALELLESYVKKTDCLNLIGKYNNPLSALETINQKQIDILFLDVQMPEVNGIAFSKMINPTTRIIFTTAFTQYATDSYRVNALDYLLKPYSYNDFLESVNKALSWFKLFKNNRESIIENEEKTDGNYMYVKSEYKYIRIDLDSILYIEGVKDYVKIVLEGNDKPILSLASMKSLEEKLPREKFIRVHRSFIVQKNKIKVIDRARIIFGNTYIPITESYKHEWQNFLNKHLL